MQYLISYFSCELMLDALVALPTCETNINVKKMLVPLKFKRFNVRMSIFTLDWILFLNVLKLRDIIFSSDQ